MLVRKLILPVIFMAVIAACTPEKKSLVEPAKDLSAVWHIHNVVRNSVDITQFVDSAGFVLTLASDYSYTLQGNHIPFVVNAAGGKWSSDDPQYPYNLIFTPTDSTNSFNASIATPVAQGQRILSITFSPGCHSNTYVYTFEKANP